MSTALVELRLPNSYTVYNQPSKVKLSRLYAMVALGGTGGTAATLS